jgi:hypothetical protein
MAPFGLFLTFNGVPEGSATIHVSAVAAAGMSRAPDKNSRFTSKGPTLLMGFAPDDEELTVYHLKPAQAKYESAWREKDKLEFIDCTGLISRSQHNDQGTGHSYEWAHSLLGSLNLLIWRNGDCRIVPN